MFSANVRSGSSSVYTQRRRDVASDHGCTTSPTSRSGVLPIRLLFEFGTVLASDRIQSTLASWLGPSLTAPLAPLLTIDTGSGYHPVISGRWTFLTPPVIPDRSHPPYFAKFVGLVWSIRLWTVPSLLSSCIALCSVILDYRLCRSRFPIVAYCEIHETSPRTLPNHVMPTLCVFAVLSPTCLF